MAEPKLNDNDKCQWDRYTTPPFELAKYYVLTYLPNFARIATNKMFVTFFKRYSKDLNDAVSIAGSSSMAIRAVQKMSVDFQKMGIKYWSMNAVANNMADVIDAIAREGEYAIHSRTKITESNKSKSASVLLSQLAGNGQDISDSQP